MTKKTYKVELFFEMRCITRGWTVQAASEKEAEAIVLSCIGEDDGCFDSKKFDKLGGYAESWDTCNGTDCEYELDTVEACEDGRYDMGCAIERARGE